MKWSSHSSPLPFPMSKVRALAFGMSVDGFSAGPRQDLENPLGVNGADIMGWFFPTNAFKQMNGLGEGEKLFDGLDMRALGYRVTRHVHGERAMHVFIERA